MQKDCAISKAISKKLPDHLSACLLRGSFVLFILYMHDVAKIMHVLKRTNASNQKNSICLLVA